MKENYNFSLSLLAFHRDSEIVTGNAFAVKFLQSAALPSRSVLAVLLAEMSVLDALVHFDAGLLVCAQHLVYRTRADSACRINIKFSEHEISHLFPSFRKIVPNF